MTLLRPVFSILALALVALLLVACGGSDKPESIDIGQWAAGYCEVLSKTKADEKSIDSQLGSTPVSALSLEARKARAATMVRALDSSFKTARDSLAKIQPPPEASRLHLATIVRIDQKIKANAESGAAIEKAQSERDIEASNARLSIAEDESHKAWSKTAEDVERSSPRVAAALNGVTGCLD